MAARAKKGSDKKTGGARTKSASTPKARAKEHKETEEPEAETTAKESNAMRAKDSVEACGVDVAAHGVVLAVKLARVKDVSEVSEENTADAQDDKPVKALKAGADATKDKSDETPDVLQSKVGTKSKEEVAPSSDGKCDNIPSLSNLPDSKSPSKDERKSTNPDGASPKSQKDRRSRSPLRVSQTNRRSGSGSDLARSRAPAPPNTSPLSLDAPRVAPASSVSGDPEAQNPAEKVAALNDPETEPGIHARSRSRSQSRRSDKHSAKGKHPDLTVDKAELPSAMPFADVKIPEFGGFSFTCMDPSPPRSPEQTSPAKEGLSSFTLPDIPEFGGFSSISMDEPKADVLSPQLARAQASTAIAMKRENDGSGTREPVITLVSDSNTQFNCSGMASDGPIMGGFLSDDEDDDSLLARLSIAMDHGVVVPQGMPVIPPGATAGIVRLPQGDATQTELQVGGQSDMIVNAQADAQSNVMPPSLTVQPELTSTEGPRKQVPPLLRRTTKVASTTSACPPKGLQSPPQSVKPMLMRTRKRCSSVRFDACVGNRQRDGNEFVRVSDGDGIDGVYCSSCAKFLKDVFWNLDSTPI